MQIAVNENGERIYPYKNGRATCQLCGSLLIAHCGEIYRPHWQHFGEKNIDCDRWKEPETEWHRKWKERFPKEWREIVIENHRADVKTPFDLVLEFQNSSISPAVIREREEFYGFMYWIINATDFDENLVLRSKVKQNLQRHKDETRADAIEAFREVDRKIVERESLRSTAYKNINLAKTKFNSKKREVESLEKYASESREIARKVAAHDPDVLRYYSWGDPSPKIAGTVDRDLCQKVSTLSGKKKQLEGEISRIEIPLITIHSYPDFNLAGTTYKVVPYKALDLKNYHAASPLLKSTMHQLFPEIRQFASEADFLVYKYKQADFLFIVDLAQRIRELETIHKNLKGELEVVSDEAETHLDTLEKCVCAWLETEISLKKQELEEIEYEIEAAEIDYEHHRRTVEYMIEEKPREYESIMERMENERAQQEGRIMQDFKGRYTLTKDLCLVRSSSPTQPKRNAAAASPTCCPRTAPTRFIFESKHHETA